MKVLGINKVTTALRKLQRKRTGGKGVVNVAVGFTKEYALAVHEKVEMKLKGQPRKPPNKGLYWDPQGKAQAKFLEAPARELANNGELSRVMFTAVGNGATLQQALNLTGLRLQREAQERVPVNLGDLKGSAFTRNE